MGYELEILSWYTLQKYSDSIWNIVGFYLCLTWEIEYCRGIIRVFHNLSFNYISKFYCILFLYSSQHHLPFVWINESATPFKFYGIFTDLFGKMIFSLQFVPLIHNVLLDTWLIISILYRAHIVTHSLYFNMPHTGNPIIV